MLQRRTMSGTNVTLSAIAMVAASLVADHAALAQPGNTFPLNGMLRDFRRSDVNFSTMAPVGGNGMYADNIALALGMDQRPLFIGGGGKVDIQWMDQDGHTIAPNMMIEAGSGGGSVMLVEPPIIRNKAVADTYDPAMGAYDPATAGPEPEYLTGSIMPELSVPELVNPTWFFPSWACGNDPIMLTRDVHTWSVWLGHNAVVQVATPITVMCEGQFRVRSRARIEILEGGSLTVYARRGIVIENDASINMNSGDSSLLSLNNMGTYMVRMANNAQVCGQITSPQGKLMMKNSAQFYGEFTGHTFDLRNNAGLHIEGSATICGREPNDVAGMFGVMSDGGIPSAAAFSTWFADVPDSNISVPTTLTLTKALAGTIWQFTTGNFYPMDGLGFGNQGQIHNNYFTFSSKIVFTHRACMGKYFEYIGTDDAWLFVNGELVMDHGGVRMPGIPQWVELDRLGLTDGQNYEMHFFMAQRNNLSSTIRIRTNAELVSTMAH